MDFIASQSLSNSFRSPDTAYFQVNFFDTFPSTVLPNDSGLKTTLGFMYLQKGCGNIPTIAFAMIALALLIALIANTPGTTCCFGLGL